MTGQADSIGTSPLSFANWNIYQFGLACTFTMGMTMLWKFPYCIYMHSVLFTVSYYTLGLLMIVPVYWIQLRVGQVYRRGLLTILSNYFPIFKGVGLVLLLWAFIYCVHHNVLLAQCVYYMFAGVQQPFPWSPDYNKTTKFATKSNVFFHGRTPAEEYYYVSVIQRTQPGVPWHLGLCLFTVSLLTCLPLIRGSHSLAKALYITVPTSVILLWTLTISALATMPSVGKSLLSLFSPHHNPVLDQPASEGVLPSQLGSTKMWVNAMDIHIMSIGLFSGVIPTLGAHVGNKKSIVKISPWLILIPMCLPYMMSLALAPFLQILTPEQHSMLQRSIQPGLTLLFVSLPEAFATANMHPIWVVAFYLCVLLLTLHHQVLLLLTIMENMKECCPRRIMSLLRRQDALTIVLCSFMLLLGLAQLGMDGIVLQQTLDQYLYSILYMAIPLIIPAFVMAYKNINPYNFPIEKICVLGWFVVGCIGIMVVEIYRDVLIRRPLLKDIWFPKWSHIIGHLVSVAILFICVIGGVIHAIYVSQGTLLQRIKGIFMSVEKDLRALPGCYEIPTPSAKTDHQMASHTEMSRDEDPVTIEVVMTTKNNDHEPAHV